MLSKSIYRVSNPALVISVVEVFRVVEGDRVIEVGWGECPKYNNKKNLTHFKTTPQAAGKNSFFSVKVSKLIIVTFLLCLYDIPFWRFLPPLIWYMSVPARNSSIAVLILLTQPKANVRFIISRKWNEN